MSNRFILVFAMLAGGGLVGCDRQPSGQASERGQHGSSRPRRDHWYRY